MKESFLSINFSAESTERIEQINGILDEYEAAGYDLSLRQLYYQLVSKNLIVNSEKSYKSLGTLVSDARYAGLIDWDMIKDRGREMVRNSHWENPGEIVKTAADSFRIDRWKDQPCYVEVMVEKQALEGVLIPVCQELDVPFTANKGYSSSSALYEAGQRMDEKLRDEKEVIVIYLGDHDPSGIDMSRDVEDRLRLFTRHNDGDTKAVSVDRIALNMDQIQKLNPPRNPAKLSDSRAAAYIRRFGKASWELDAVEPKALAQLVRDAVTARLDMKLWKRSGTLQETMRKELHRFADNYGK